MTTVFAYFVFVLAIVVISGNWLVLARYQLRNKRSSFVPFIGGGLGLIGCLVHPSIPWAWGGIAVLLDPGCGMLQGILTLLSAAYRSIRDLFGTGNGV